MCHLQIYRKKLHFVEWRLSVIIKRVKMWAATKIVSSRLGLAWVYSLGDGCILYKSKHVE